MSKKKRPSERMQAEGKRASERLSTQKGNGEASKAEAPKSEPAKPEAAKAEAAKLESKVEGGKPAKDVGSESAATLPAPKKSDAAKVKLGYVDPGAERKLPQPPHVSIGPGDRVRLKKAQEYADTTIAAGEEGFALNPSSQAACWCVQFFTAGGGKVRVVPEWLLETVGPRAVAH